MRKNHALKLIGDVGGSREQPVGRICDINPTFYLIIW